MKQILLFALIFGIIGLVAGYLFFGKTGDEYISINRFFQKQRTTSNGGTIIDKLSNAVKDTVDGIENSMIGLDSIRWNIILSGILGVSIGLNAGLLSRKKKR